MADFAADLMKYFKDILAVDINPVIWEGQSRLPAFLRDRYVFFRAGLLDLQVLFMCDKNGEEHTPAGIRKHLTAVGEYWEGLSVYACKRVSPFKRKRLIKQRVPFVVPYNQMYLPDLALDLREYFRSGSVARDALSPAAQAVIIYALMETTGRAKITPGQMAVVLRYSAMTMTRAFNQIEAAQVLPVRMEGRERCMLLNPPKTDLWLKALPCLTSPVMKRVFIEPVGNIAEGYLAGISALAGYSNLNPPETKVHAVGRHVFKRMQAEGRMSVIPFEEPGCLEIEVWAYDPGLFCGNDRYVDQLSLYLSLKDDPDERVQAALDGMLKALPW